MNHVAAGLCGAAGSGASGAVSKMLEPASDGWGRLDFPDAGVHLACELTGPAPGAPPSGPASSEDGRSGAVFAGWLHNHEALRRELGLRPGASVSEVLLGLYRRHGDSFVERLAGPFTLALWDGERRRLLLVRDASGLRCLYTCQHGEDLVFASRIKGVLRSGRSSRRMDPSGVDTLLTLRRIPGDSTIVSDIQRLPTGCRLSWTAGSSSVERWWSPSLEPLEIDFAEASERLEAALEQTVARCCPQEGRVGVLYSGGIDSTSLLTAADRLAPDRVEAFTFLSGKAHGDHLNARRLTRSLGVPHEEVQVGDLPFEDLFPTVVWIQDEPVADLSALNPFMVTRTSARRTRYTLCGVGPDQALGGCLYHRPIYYLLRFGWLPGLTRLLGAAGGVLQGVQTGLLHRLLERVEPSYSLDEDGKRRVGQLLAATEDPREVMQLMMSLFPPRERSALYTEAFARRLAEGGGQWSPPDFIGGDAPPARQMERLFRFEVLESVAHTQVRALENFAHHHGQEVSLPYMDPAVLELFFRLPFELKIRRFQGKVLLRRMWAGDRTGRQPKQSGNIALDKVFGRRLHDFGRDVLTPERIRDAGLVRPDAVEELLVRCRERPTMLPTMQLMGLTTLELWRDMYLGQAS